MDDVFLGSRAVRAGLVTPYQLRTAYSSMFPDVYGEAGSVPSLRARTRGAWLWSRERGVVAGVAAAALHGADWVDVDEPIELIWRNTNPPVGVRTRNERIADDEIVWRSGILTTSDARTAFDLGRRRDRFEALGRLDSLARATAFSTAKVSALIDRYPGARGVRQLRELLTLVDRKAASPRESWLRLKLLDAGFPAIATQIAVGVDRILVGILDMGWEEYKVAAEYDGDQHRYDRRQYLRDQRRLPRLQKAGWIVIRVVAEDRIEDVIAGVDEALRSRGWRPGVEAASNARGRPSGLVA
ncbi:endonuclease domain-containing protein [Mycolicibacterium confluentis]|uniref:Uncharacterized protein n=1 Tax=Mycolicibacterium confluentis TaxID=28047 RepID=A0A7I7Y553_9MYCO|nr:hypothetical protein [Mycolicibacterium confluentis]MCV7319194.1 hypothetical protein [Mycolicibacterium confluentis]ORV24904.1 hypothetical protein AWB99_05330 [Mycolicibacterium confluentis]BBZ36808.1 hypothetical protein MCNF_54130 [Mycolicibacterium confluentis]